jgi:hypothetical protein
MGLMDILAIVLLPFVFFIAGRALMNDPDNLP